jgi:hypothetical protein
MADIWSDSEVEQHKLEIIILFYIQMVSLPMPCSQSGLDRYLMLLY